MIGIALFGAGRMARVHAASMAAAGARLVAVHDVVSAAADALATEYRATATANVDETLDHPDVAGVIVAVSSDSHVDLVLRAAAAGKAVMCEKPLALDLNEARRCVETLGHDAQRVFLAFNRRFDPGHTAVRQAVAAGVIGRLEQLTITSRDPAPPPLDYIPRSGGLFRDMMIHDFDMARSILMEEPVRLYAQASSVVDPRIGKLGDVDLATVTMTTASGKQVIILNCRRAAYGFDQRIEAFGSSGMVISDNPHASAVKRYAEATFGAPDRFRAFFMERYGESYRIEIEAFVRSVHDGTPPPVNAIDGLRASYLAEAATASLRQQRPIDLDPECRVTWDG